MVTPICPHCKVALNRRSQKGVFNYSCPSCYGFAVHFGGLKKVMSQGQVLALWKTAKSAANGVTPCSHCRHPMKTVYADPVQLDLCLSCNLIWVDTGEWDDLAKKNGRGLEEPSTKPVESEAVVYGRLLLQLENEKEESKRSHFEPVSIADIGVLKALVTIVGIPIEEKSDDFLAAPWVTWSLMLLCLLGGVLSVGRQEWFLHHLSFKADRSGPMLIITSLTSFFLHKGILHLAGNMYFLWIFGDNVEDHLGKARYILLLMASTLAGSYLFAMLHPSAVPLIGASGGISGVVAYYLYRFPKRRFVVFWFFRFIAIPGILFGAFFLLKEFLGALLEISNAGGGVAHLAHLGGATAGIIFAIFLAPEKDLRR